MLTRRYQLLLITALVLAAYYPVLFAGFSSVDDHSIVASYNGLQAWTVWGYVVPHGGLYFRPVLGLSFLTDKLLLGLDPFWMHLENVVLHLFNAVLIYFLTVRILAPANRTGSLVPALASLLFGLHPINTESVSWISGRTDVLATTFILMSALLLLHFTECGQRRYLALSLSALLAAVFTKETSLFFLFGFILISIAERQADRAHDTAPGRDGEQILNATMALILGIIVIAFVSFMARSGDFIAHQSRMAMTIRYIMNDWMRTMFVILQAFGFYLKKLVFPFPLNFAIMEIDPLYELIAVPLVAACMYIASRRTVPSGLFSAGVLLIMPAFVLAFGQIAWTPYAERYIYMTSALVIPSAVVYLSKSISFQRPSWEKIALAALVVLMFVSVINRSIVWSSDFTLAKDTVEKSPLSRDMRAMYGSLLAVKGDYPEALRQLEQGKKIPFLGYDERFDVSIASIYNDKGERDRAIRHLQAAFMQSRGKSVRILSNLIDLLEARKNEDKDVRHRQALNEELFSYTLKLFKLDHDSHLLYKLGLISLELGHREKALKYFQQTFTVAVDNEYKQLAKNKIIVLSKSNGRRHAENTL